MERGDVSFGANTKLFKLFKLSKRPIATCMTADFKKLVSNLSHVGSALVESKRKTRQSE